MSPDMGAESFVTAGDSPRFKVRPDGLERIARPHRFLDITAHRERRSATPCAAAAPGDPTPPIVEERAHSPFS